MKGEEKFIDQISSNSTYAKKIKKKEAKITWEEQAGRIISKLMLSIQSQVLGLSLKNLRYKIFKAKEINIQGPVGEILDDNLTVGAGKNSIKILEIQKEGKNKLKVKIFNRKRF